jgi:hypothetical protein
MGNGVPLKDIAHRLGVDAHTFRVATLLLDTAAWIQKLADELAARGEDVSDNSLKAVHIVGVFGDEGTPKGPLRKRWRRPGRRTLCGTTTDRLFAHVTGWTVAVAVTVAVCH